MYSSEHHEHANICRPHVARLNVSTHLGIFQEHGNMQGGLHLIYPDFPRNQQDETSTNVVIVKSRDGVGVASRRLKICALFPVLWAKCPKYGRITGMMNTTSTMMRSTSA
jgi:hypothetical protein